MTRIDLLRERLAKLDPVAVEIRDDSAQHAGHAGAKEGGHFTVTIVAACFAGLPAIHRHRLVYDAVGDLMQNGVHALSIHAKTPAEALNPPHPPPSG